MINEIRFILFEHDDEFENFLQREMQPFVLKKDIIEENGDVGTTITIVFSIIQTALAVPGFITALHEIICYSKQRKEDKSSKDRAIVDSDLSWKFIINGDKYDLGGLPTNEERYRVLDRILEKYIGR